MSKSYLHRLIEELPDSKVSEVQAYLEIIRAGGLKALLAQAPEEDEEISPEEETAIREAEADIAANGTLSHQEARKMLNL